MPVHDEAIVLEKLNDFARGLLKYSSLLFYPVIIL